MSIKNIPLESLVVNRANDRHGELENETSAIAWLFATKESHMKNLARDIVQQGQIYELPLVAPDGDQFVVFDGNRRITCLKLLHNPKRAPTLELQSYFSNLKAKWIGEFPSSVQCQVEVDRDKIDEILFRRHTGVQNGVGQWHWNDRMKSNFVARSGKESGVNVADLIESLLSQAGMLPKKKIPRSTVNRLLSAEPFRNRVGFGIRKGKFTFNHQPDVVLSALARIADDMASGKIVLGKIWDVDGKTAYLDALEAQGVLPRNDHLLTRSDSGDKPRPPVAPTSPTTPSPTPQPRPTRRTTLIPQTDFNLAWPGRLQRHRQIWEELQFHLDITKHPNAVSVLFRVLLELAVENYISQRSVAVQDGDKLAARALKVANHQFDHKKIDQKLLGVVKKFQQLDQLVSADTLNRYVHSPNFAPSPDHLFSLWDTLSAFVVVCLEA